MSDGEIFSAKITVQVSVNNNLVKWILSGRGGECIGHMVQNWLKETGIQLEVSTLYPH